MEKKQEVVTRSAVDSPPSVDLNATPETILAQVRGVRQLIPEIMPIPAALALSRSRLPHVGSDFVNASTNAVSASPALEGALGRTGADVRQYADDTLRWAAVEEEVRSLLQAIVAANVERRHRVGLTALQTYSIARQLVRQPEHADLKPHVTQMTRMSKFGRNRRKAAQPQPAPAPAPQQ
jgi:hypothetical protein